ncbi:MAG: DUF2064 domain-containing protein [candidate division Zixibacteria bacterium]|nr:DUF2064 domain-containing protein [candidate division Zixibacteria bacterium]
MNSECTVIIANDPEKSSDLNAIEPSLGKRKTSYLGRAMFFDTLALCLSIPNTDVIVCYHPADSKANFEKMIGLFSREEKSNEIKSKVDRIKMFPQNGHSIMDYISNAYKQVFDLNYKRVTMVGAYCIPIDPNLIKAGFILLKENDIVVGPSFSGRYYLFGMSRFMPEVFDGVKWESEDFYIKLRENIGTAQAKVQELELSYEVYSNDELNQLISDINRWRSVGDLRTAYHTEKFLRVL